MLRDDLQKALKESMLAKDVVTTSAIRMIIAGQKEKDVEARGKGQEKASDAELLSMIVPSVHSTVILSLYALSKASLTMASNSAFVPS